MTDFKLTYATMFNPPEELHARFDAALVKVKAGLGKEYPMIINNQDVFADEKYERRSPVNTDSPVNDTISEVLLGVASHGLLFFI